MNKPKVINFLKGYKINKTSRRLYILLVVSILFYTIVKVYVGITSIQKLEADVNNYGDIKEVESESTMQVHSNLSQIKKAYELIGVNNITKVIMSSSKIEIEGVCLELNILEKIKNDDTISNICVNSIRKEEDNYVFNLTYQVGDSVEAK